MDHPAGRSSGTAPGTTSGTPSTNERTKGARSRTKLYGSVAQGLLGAEGRHDLLVRQFPLVLVMSLVVVLMAVLYPDFLADPLFITGFLILVLSVGLAAFVPWKNFAPEAVLLLPVLDLAAIGVARTGAAGAMEVLGLLVIFPTIWLASADKERGTLIATVGMVAMVLSPIAFSDVTLTAQVWSKLILLPVTIGGVGLTVSSMTRRLEASSAQNRQERQLLHSILQAIDVGVVALDTQGQAVASNDAELATRARLSAVAVGGSPAAAAARATMDALPLYEPDGTTLIPFDRRPLMRAIRGEHFINYLHWDQVAGEKVARYATSGPVHNDAGEVVGCVVAFSDVTPLMEAAAKQSAFVASVSHELRTPLTSILGYTDLLRERLEDDGGPPAPELAVIERGAHRLGVVVEDLLTAASATMSMTPVRFDLAESIHSAIVSIRPTAHAAGIALEQHITGPVPVMVDPERIGQLLDNLLSNAIKYSPAGTTVNVQARTDAPAGQVVVEIHDQGHGVSNADTELVFDTFYRSEGARQSGVQGAGLGLSVVRAIAERHGGTVQLHSAKGRGTTVELRLPALKPAPHSTAASPGTPFTSVKPIPEP
ncbi:sensor histidine kinase [Arthrobacter sp. Sr24]